MTPETLAKVAKGLGHERIEQDTPYCFYFVRETGAVTYRHHKSDGDLLLAILNRAAELSPKGGPQYVGRMMESMTFEGATARVQRREPKFLEAAVLAFAQLPECQ